MATPAAEPLAVPAAERHGAVPWRRLAALLRPFPGRAEMALRLALVCTLSAGIALWFQTPEAALTAYVGFFLVRADRATSVVLGAGMLVLATVLVGLVLLMTQAIIGRPAVLLATMTGLAFGLLYLSSASKLAPVGGILALVLTYALSLLGGLPSGELATRALLYAWLMVAIPAGVCIAVNLLMGPAPRQLAQRALARRLRSAAELLRQGREAAPGEWQALRTEGNAELKGWLRLAALEHSSPAQDIAALRCAADQLPRVLQLAALLATTLPDAAARSRVADTLDGMAAIFAQGGYPVDIVLPVATDTPQPAPAAQALSALRSTLAGFADAQAPDAPADPEPEAGFFAPNALHDPAHVRFALKATGAAMACYLFYTLLDWPGIHTAFITCFIVALGTTGETVQKLRLRIAGCLVGAALSAITLLGVLPHIEGLTGLLPLLFAVTLGASWVAAGRPAIAYAGFQIAFAFYLCVLQGPGPAYDLGVARDRILGILLGNAVVFVVFTQLWPVSVAKRIDAALALLLRRMAHAARAPESRGAAVQTGEADTLRGTVAADLDLLAYEPPRVRPPAHWIAQRRELLRRAEALSAPLALQAGEPQQAELAQALQGLAQAASGDRAALPGLPASRLPAWLAHPLQALADALRALQSTPSTTPTGGPHAAH